MVISFTQTRSHAQNNTYCAFFNLSRYDCLVSSHIVLNTYSYSLHNNTNQSGSFSTDGISTDGIIQSDTTNNTFVQCSTTHLTSFAVLVDVSEGSATVMNLGN